MASERGWVLVVDDDLDVRESLCEALRDEGWCATGAGDGLEALAEMRRDAPPSLILLDLWMPRCNGYEFLAELRRGADISAVPVVLLTADTKLDGTPASVGAVAYLQKPVRLEQLLETVQQYCPPGRG
jgi:CheY-like chemotaxis protein